MVGLSKCPFERCGQLMMTETSRWSGAHHIIHPHPQLVSERDLGWSGWGGSEGTRLWQHHNQIISSSTAQSERERRGPHFFLAGASFSLCRPRARRAVRHDFSKRGSQGINCEHRTPAFPFILGNNPSDIAGRSSLISYEARALTRDFAILSQPPFQFGIVSHFFFHKGVWNAPVPPWWNFV